MQRSTVSGMGVPVGDTVVIIPSHRPAPVRTLEIFGEHLGSSGIPVVLLSDPARVGEHAEWLRGEGRFPNVTQVEGRQGLSPQTAVCYRWAWEHGYRYWFRMDDDLTERFFVTKSPTVFASARSAIYSARACAELFGVSLAGFVNSSRRDWIGTGYGRGWGLIHGGACIARSAEDPSEFIDESLPAYDDVYRSAAHRAKDGCVGRVRFIGLDKRESLRDSSVGKSEAIIQQSKDIILGAFPQLVSCNGTRTLDGGKQVIPNWKLRPGKPGQAREQGSLLEGL